MLVQGECAGISAAKYAKGKEIADGSGAEDAKKLLALFENNGGICSGC
ncbi:MAG: hypothetical protein FWE24_01265 [Defluviitaleaceae bacterium]|nr:hypothetical protein [Defluviitaleaceae bacterium]